jgi:hypothetical protein
MSEFFDDFGDLPATDDAILASDEPDAWTLSELQASADLGALRSAWSSADERIF